MSVRPRRAGAAPIAPLAGLRPLERQVVRCVRLWCAGPDGPGVLVRELAARRGEERAGRLARRLDDFLRTTVRHARRPLLAHAPDCPCAGSDECVLARFVALAAEGSREEAILMASLIVRADVALPLATLAEELGLGLMRGQEPRIA